MLSLAKTFLACAAMAIATGAAVRAQRFLARATQQANISADNAQTEQQLTDTAELQGPFSLGDQQYTVLLRKKVLRDATAASTLVGLEILDSHRNAVYQETFPYALADGRFSHIVTLSTSLLSGRGGSALVIRFIEQAAAMPGIEGPPWKESWQVFGMVNGRLTAFGAVLPLGQGADITVGGVVAGVMVKGGIAVVPLASTAEALEFRAWTGNFYAFVPVRVDWVHGQWGEGEQCYELAGGTPRAKGCSMRAEAQRTPRPGSADILFVRLFATADGNTYNSQDVAVRDDSQVDFLNVLAMVHWGANGNRVECSFDNVWLRTRIDGKEGWVNGEEAFEALGLPRESPK